MGYACKDGGVYFYVKDTGIGIADDKKGKVFQRFEKLDEFAQGTGLGLSIVKEIIQAHGENILTATFLTIKSLPMSLSPT